MRHSPFSAREEKILGLADELIEALGGSAADGVCDICGRDTAPHRNKSLRALSHKARTIRACTSCRTVLRRQISEHYGRGSVEAFRLNFMDQTNALDHLPPLVVAQWLALRLANRTAGAKQ